MIIEIDIAITVTKPAFSPKILITNAYPSSAVDGIDKSETDNFSGDPNLNTFAIACKS